jgi:hypothetical protein
LLLAISPTYPQSKLTSNLDDYGKKGSITLGISSGAKRRPLHAVVTPLLTQAMTR